MKYKVKYEKSNLSLMTFMIIFCLFTCICWLVLKEYIYFVVYLLLTIFISITYYFTCYYLKDKYLLIRLGFIFIRVKYSNIKEIYNLRNAVKLKFKKISIKIYPNNKDIFYSSLKQKVGGK